MAVEQTDDELHAGVQSCFREAQDRAPQRTLPPCERNAFYKRKACEAVSRSAQETEACVRDPKHFPYPVLGGVGG